MSPLSLFPDDIGYSDASGADSSCFFFRESSEPAEDYSDLPVQGPLPEEPEDGPWRRNESGIRKL